MQNFFHSIVHALARSSCWTARGTAMILAVAAAALPSAARAVDFSYDANGTISWTVIPWAPAGTPGSADNVSVSSTTASSTLNINTAVSISNFNKTGSLGLFLNASGAPQTFSIGSGLSVTEGTFTLRNSSAANVLSVSTGGFSVAAGAQFALGLAASNNGRPVFTAAATSTNLVQSTMLINGYNSTVQTTQPAVSLGHLVLDGGSVNLSAGTAGQRTANNVTVSSLSSVGSGVRTVTTSEDDGVTAVSTLLIAGLNDTPADFAGIINNNVNVVKQGAGTQIFSGQNTYKGTTTVSGGTLELNRIGGPSLGSAASLEVGTGATLLISQSDQVGDSTTVTLSGGTIKRGNGVSETMGALSLTAASALDFGSGAAGTLAFGTYQANSASPSFQLTLDNFTPGNAFIFQSTGFVEANIASYFTFGTGFVDYDLAQSGSTFTITAIPEPSTLLAAAVLCALGALGLRRRVPTPTA